MKKGYFFFFIFFHVGIYAQYARIYPSNWWVGMKNPALQLLIHGGNGITDSISIQYPGITVEKITRLSNKHYVVIDLIIGEQTMPGTFKIDFIQKKKKEALYRLIYIIHKYQIKRNLINIFDSINKNLDKVLYDIFIKSK